ncbi:MAG: hypothetical protein ACRC57_11900 [Sarcina sp.]
MFLLIKKGNEIIAGLESSDAVIAAMYASIKEEYNEIELEIAFENTKVVTTKNILKFIKEIDKLNLDTVEINGINSAEEIAYSNFSSDDNEDIEETSNIEIEVDDNHEEEGIQYEIEEPLNFEEEAESKEIEIEEPVTVKIEKPVEHNGNSGIDRTEKMMENLKQEQKNEGIIDLENDKVNTLVYKEHLMTYMKLGFASNLLMKKAQDCNDTAERARLYTYCEAIDKRTEEFELGFKRIGLTTGQIHTFRMEVLREVRKYRNDTIKEVCDYVNKLYSISDDLIKTLK